MKRDAIESIIELGLKEQDSLDISIEMDDAEKYAKKIYREDGKVYVDVNESDTYDQHKVIRCKYLIERLNLLDLIDLLEGLEQTTN